MEAWTPDQLKKYLDSGESLFLKLWKKGCGICKLSTPATDRMEEKNRYELKFGKIQVDDYPEMLEISDTDVLPAFFVFNKGKMAGEYHGFKGIQQLEHFLMEAMEKDE